MNNAVVVAVCTRGRHVALTRLLTSLPAGAPDAWVIVVDNDPAGSIKVAVTAVPVATRYVHEPGAGSPGTKHCGSRGGAATLAFIDDDPMVAPGGWLASLVAKRHAIGAAW